MSGIIKTKDIKILWARAAGLCSMPDCRRKLTMDNQEETASLTLGEMCHIVGETNSEKSPRGISKLPEEDRNNYSNLVLLCSHHHTEIDKNETDWPVEILHKVKDDHELWVEETLTAKKLTPEELVYSTIVDNLNASLQLNAWNWFISNAVRNLIHRDFIDTLEFIDERQLAIVWPNKNEDFEQAIQDLMKSYSEYMHHFMKYSTLQDNGDFLKEDTHYKRIFPNPNYEVISQRNIFWMQKNYLLLCKFTYFLNVFASKVRQYLNPMFYVTKGNFLVIDELGVSNGGEGYLMLPTLENIQPRLDELNKKIEKFEKENKNWC